MSFCSEDTCRGPDERRIGFELHAISNLIKRRFDSFEGKKYADKVTGVHGWIIGYLYARRDTDVFQRDIEKTCNIRPSSASNILSLMEKNGMITRVSVPYDNRLKKIVLTQKAIDISESIHRDIDETELLLQKGISGEELSVFYTVLDKIKHNLEENK